jgi:DinB superfamily
VKSAHFPLVGVLALSGALYSQTPSNPLTSDLRQAYQTVKNNLHRAAQKMPEPDYSFRPTPEVRTFAEVLGHAAVAEYHTCSALTGTDGGSLSKAENKASIIAALDQASGLCDKAFDSLTDSNAAEMIKFPRGQKSRLGGLTGLVMHDTEQYAILGVYMRLKGIVPPSSEPAGGR